MTQGTKAVLIFGGALFLLKQYGSTMLPFSTTTTPGVMPVTPGGSLVSNALTPNQISQMATTSSSLVQSMANQQINQEIQSQNLDISVAGTVATSAIGILAATHILAASVAGPIGAAVAAVVVLVKALVSDVHLYANQLVQKYENPFAQYVENLINAVNAEYLAGTLNINDLAAAYQALTNSWSVYESTMHQLQNTSQDWYIVSTQSLNNLDNQYMGVTLPNGKVLGAGEGGAYGDTPNYGFMSSWLDWMAGLAAVPWVQATAAS